MAVIGLARAQPAPEPSPQGIGDEERRAAHVAYEEGKSAFEAHDYARAARLFLEAYAHAPHHDSLWNAGRSYELAGEAVRAANLYARYLDEAPPGARDRDRATASRKELATRLGRVEIHARGVEDSRIDGEPVQGGSAYVEPGQHVVTGRANGREVRRPFTVGPGEVASVVLEPAPELAAQAPAPAGAAPRGIRIFPPAVAYGGAALTLVASAATIASGVDTLNAKQRYESSASTELLDSGRSKETRTNVLFWTTVGLGVLTGVAAIWLVDWQPTPAVRAAVLPGAARVEAVF
jgi:hypothetical protein